MLFNGVPKRKGGAMNLKVGGGGGGVNALEGKASIQ